MKVYTVLKKYLHWDFESVACYLCVVSFVLLRGIWLKKPVGHILSFVSEARLCNFLKQSQAIDSIMKEVELVGNSGEYNFDLVKIALKKKGIISDESMVDFIPSTNPPTVPDLKKHLSGSKNLKK